METNAKFNLKGVDSELIVFDDRIEIAPKGFLGKMGGKGSETIFIKNITSVEVRECSFINGGHIQFSAPGTNEKNNKVDFGGFGDRKLMNETAKNIKSFVLTQLNAPQSQASNAVSASDEIAKLSKLKADGTLTDEEFQAAKKRLLNI